jgi:hypothetical protein
MLLVQANVGIERQQRLSCEELTYELRWDEAIYPVEGWGWKRCR